MVKPIKSTDVVPRTILGGVDLFLQYALICRQNALCIVNNNKDENRSQYRIYLKSASVYAQYEHW